MFSRVTIMGRQSLILGLAVLTFAGVALAVDHPVTIKKVDADKRVLVVHAGDKDRSVSVAADVKVLGSDGKELADGLRTKELTDGATATISVEKQVITAIRLTKADAGRKAAPGKVPSPKPSLGLKPLTEMSAQDSYKGEDGGLYGGGRNEPPELHQAAARKATSQIVLRDAAGKPSPDGIIAFISISMSNATMEFSTFVPMANADPDKSPRVKVVDCAQGGKAMAQWATPTAPPWEVAMQRLKTAKVTPQQVQVAWIKIANVRPTGDLKDHGKILQKDTQAVIQLAKAKFPNLQIVYLDGRIYAGYAKTELNPEPYAYESGFVCRWLIQDQIKGSADLNHDPAKGEVKAPVLLWGPYLWADGMTPRKSDGLVWKEEDLRENDRTHPSTSGRKKVADLLLKFCKTDPYAMTWYLKNSGN
jgi:hypothetical protein